ncbi:MAG: hypothetical protein LAN62_18085 [Acidobacteriia bacterium]|nr:hypothetical protein [Terriglobia bacterium]
MNGHLNSEQLVASALGESDRVTALHLQACPQCREEIQSLHASLDVWVEDVGGGAGTSEAFWRRQREAIDARLGQWPWHRPWKHLACATATVTLVLLATAVLYRRPAPRVNEAPVDDNALLLSVHNSIRSEVPQALKPVALLTQEIDRAEEVRPTLSK